MTEGSEIAEASLSGLASAYGRWDLHYCLMIITNRTHADRALRAVQGIIGRAAWPYIVDLRMSTCLPALCNAHRHASSL